MPVIILQDYRFLYHPEISILGPAAIEQKKKDEQDTRPWRSSLMLKCRIA